MRLFAIGDVHGCSIALERLIRELQLQPEDVLITLGDYVDRGPDSRGVIEHLLALQSRCQLIALRGNHEEMMLEARYSRPMLAGWISCGGGATIDSYDCRSLDEIPDSHWRFLEETRPYFETGRDFFVHANAHAHLELASQPDVMLYWAHLDSPTPHRSGRRMICGHTSQKSGLPLNLGHTVCIDTYAHGGGWLTCLEARTGFYWQANQKGELRTGTLE